MHYRRHGPVEVSNYVGQRGNRHWWWRRHGDWRFHVQHARNRCVSVRLLGLRGRRLAVLTSTRRLSRFQLRFSAVVHPKLAAENRIRIIEPLLMSLIRDIFGGGKASWASCHSWP